MSKEGKKCWKEGVRGREEGWRSRDAGLALLGSARANLRRSLALSEAREALQELSSGLLSAVGRVWSSAGWSLPCFHCS